jgi:hypothetical protein
MTWSRHRIAFYVNSLEDQDTRSTKYQTEWFILLTSFRAYEAVKA